MSGSVRAGLLFGLGSVLAFVGSLLLAGILGPLAFLLAFISVVALGWGAGYTGAKWSNTPPGKGAGRGAIAGAIGGLISLFGLLIAFIALSQIFLAIPGFEEQFQQAFEQAAQENPGAEVPDIGTGTLIGTGFGIIGFLCGIVNFVLMLGAGAIGGLTYKGTPQADYVAAGSAAGYHTPQNMYNQPPQGTSYGQPGQGGSYSQPQPGVYDQPGQGGSYSQPGQPGPYTPPQPSGEIRYDPNDPNRPQQ